MTPRQYSRRALPMQDSHLFANDLAHLMVFERVEQAITDAVAEERAACAAAIDDVADECLATIRSGPAVDVVVTVVRSAARIVRARGGG